MAFAISVREYLYNDLEELVLKAKEDSTQWINEQNEFELVTLHENIKKIAQQDLITTDPVLCNVAEIVVAGIDMLFATFKMMIYQIPKENMKVEMNAGVAAYFDSLLVEYKKQMGL